MNIDTGQIHQFSEEQKALAELRGHRLIEIDESLRTERQRETGHVYLNDTASALGKQLRAARSAYAPHVGAKELARLAAK